MKSVTEPTFTVEIYLAGNMADIERCCAEYCMTGLCVSIEPVKFVYTGGRYADAMVRHMVAEAIEGPTTPDSGLLHAAHTAWNALAVLELKIREQQERGISGRRS